MSEAGAVLVVVPAHQAAATIGAALASVAAQTVPPGEAVVVDDGSTDGTSAAAERWHGILPLRVLRSELPQGPALARDLAIRSRSDASLVALLDADDVWLPDHLETLCRLHRRVGGLVCGRPLRWIPGAGVGLPGGTTHGPASGAGDQLLALLASNFVFVGSLFPTSSYERVGGFRDVPRGAEDWDLWIRMVRDGARVTVADHPTVLYRLSHGSLSFDDRTLDADIAVIELAVAEAASPAEASAAARSLRRLRARRQLVRAYAAAREGRAWAARGHALAALGGRRAVAARAAAMVASPGMGVRQRDGRRFEAGRWLAG